MKKRALFSLHLLDKVEEFAAVLLDLGWEIIASRETYDILSKKGMPATEIAAFTGIKEDYGFPATLHPKIEAYLTLPKGPRIDLVYVIPYPLSIGNDVGGRTLLALAAKGKRIPVMSVADMQLVVAELKDHGAISKDLHQGLLEKTHALISSHYDDLLKERKTYDAIFANFCYNLKNGENPYQVPAALFSAKNADPLSISRFRQVSGEPPCFTNLADADSIIHTLCLASQAFQLKYGRTPYICIAAKHGNACGMSVSWNSGGQAAGRALFGNPTAIWGGELIANFNIDAAIANILLQSKKRQGITKDANWMLDVILSPGFTKEAVRILGQRRQRKLLENKMLLSPYPPLSKYAYRFIRGGILRQPPHNFILDFKKAEVAKKGLSKAEIDSLIIAWAVAYSSNHGGNEIALVNNAQLIGVGGGPSTVEAAIVARARAQRCGHSLEGAVFAANAFFPFVDAPGVLAEAGVKAGLVPQGGKHIDLVKAFFRERAINMVYLAEPFRGFSRH